MKHLQVITPFLILCTMTLVSCSSNKMAVNSTQDNMYFMASDARVARANAVQNNSPESFRSLSSSNDQNLLQESFSSRNVNPDYIAKYQVQSNGMDEETVYFEENVETTGSPNIDVYNNYYSAAPGSFGGFNNNFNAGLGFGGFGMSGFGMPFGFRPRMNFGFGFGSPWMGIIGDPMFGFGMPMMGFGGMGGFGMPMMGFGGFGMPMMGFGGMGGFGMPMMGFGGFGMNNFYGYGMGFNNFGNQLIILPGSEFATRGVTVGARPTRGASFAGTSYSPNSNAGLVPSTARANARNAAINTNSSNRGISNANNNSRVSSRDFSTSQNDYNSRSRVAGESVRNVNSAALNRTNATRSRSAMPSANPSNSVNNTNSRSGGGAFNTTSRSSARTYNTPSRSATTSPSYNRQNASPSYNRFASPSNDNRGQRSTSSPSFNRSSTPSRSNSSTSNFSTPSRSSSGPSISTPSRSSAGSSGGGSRSGRGN